MVHAGEPLTSADLVHIQNPADAKQRCIEHFYHIKEGAETLQLSLLVSPVRKAAQAGGCSVASSTNSAVAAGVSAAGQDISVASGGVEAEAGSLQPKIKKCESMQKVLDEANARKAEVEAAHNKLVPNLHATSSVAEAQQVDRVSPTAAPSSNQQDERKAKEGANTSTKNTNSDVGTHHLYTDHRMAAGFTSTVVVGRTTQVYRQLSEREQMLPIYARCKQQKMKSYVRMETSAGGLNLELYTHLTPRTTDSFLRHCVSGYYEGTIFHRLIPNFMVQGGRAELRVQQHEKTPQRPLVSRSGFSNGQAFEDEIMGQLSHQGIGVLAMAHDGHGNRNMSEFYITFKSCTHLDGKHTIFGRGEGDV